MADWSTAASLATAVGTLVLALATFVAVRAANRAARVAEYSMQIGIRPLLMPSRLEDPVQKIMWGDDFIAGLAGGTGIAQASDGAIHLAMSLRNSGSGIAVIHGWHLGLSDPHDPHDHAEPDSFRPQIRDLYVPGGDIGFWQGSLRDPDDPDHAALARGRDDTPALRGGGAVLRSRGWTACDRSVRTRAVRRWPVVVLGGQALEPRPPRPSPSAAVGAAASARPVGRTRRPLASAPPCARRRGRAPASPSHRSPPAEPRPSGTGGPTWSASGTCRARTPTSASRSSFGKANPIWVSSRENAR